LWLNTGRRPMKKYPNLWLSPVELREAANLYEQSGIPAKDWHVGFRFVASRVDDKVQRGTPITAVNCYAWVIGFGLDHALDQRAKSLNVKRLESYAKGAK
jgi:hypothetical protein